MLVNTAYDDLSERIERAYEKIYELDELRNIITYVPQDCYLFEGTIAENIAFGRNRENVPSMDMIIAAAKKALLKNKTVIMVSHRMTGMDKFERVVRME